MLYQQGDVLIESIETLPKKLQKHNNVLAEGEATGHAHTIDLSNADVYCDKEGNLYVEVTGDKVVVQHEEHKPITIPKGRYKVRQVREYDHFLEQTRRVKD